MEFCVTVYQVLWLCVSMCDLCVIAYHTQSNDKATYCNTCFPFIPCLSFTTTTSNHLKFLSFLPFPSSPKASTMYATMALCIPFPNSLPDTVIVRHDCRFAGRMPQHSLVPPYGQWSWNADVPGGHCWGAAAIYVADGDGGGVDAAVVAGLFGAVDDCGV